VDTWTSGSSPTTGINLGNIDFTPYIALSGTIGTVTVDNNTPDYINISAYQVFEDPWMSGPNFYGTVTGSTWRISNIPPDFSGTLRIQIRAEYNGDSYYKEVDTWTSGSLPVTVINLEGVDFIPYIALSGTIGTVTVGGSTPNNVYLYAYQDEQSFYGEVNGADWRISRIPQDFSGTLKIRIQAEHNGDSYYKEVDTWTSGSSTTINLESVAFTRIGGMVTTDGTNPLETGCLYVFDDATEPDFDSVPVDISNGSFSGYIDSGITSGCVVVVDLSDYSNPVYYATSSPVSIGASMSLDLSTMTPVTLPGP
jgi:predicted aspartyl protease